ncbi:condensin complex subunit 2/barren [Cristinia sonorae]|uniref:Condensin complex subunit 2 n=1 Tax=Cristinia sonorae TaxID=1940300 RepID=A0A8K0UJR4_9AGAR|nr:condensin complex subunit 2/barren [Cristinia sonorae]
MPPSRTAHARASKQQKDAKNGSDTDNDTEPETPKPMARTLSKKRLSDAYDVSFNSDSGRVPLKSVNINDDAAEKRRRRKSTKILQPENAEAGPSSDANAGNPDEVEDRTGAQARQKQQLLSIAQAPILDVPLDVMSHKFEEWMKMATDNKINAANSWNFALIDYFHDMSLLRDKTDNSINFQRASCTLDGCVKIWTSRVDSVGTETGKLLSNLASEGRGEDEDGANSDGDGQDPSQTQRKRKTRRPESTLAKDAAQLRSKKLDLEFSVDPLFRKTCADFDEGGAQGLLMNHLSLGVGTDGSLRVVFDAGDSMGNGDEDDTPLEEPPEDIDLSYLREQFLPNLELLENKAISHSLQSFSFSKDSFAFDETTMFRDNGHDDNDDDDNEPAPFEPGPDFGAPMDVDGEADAPPPAEDFFIGDQAAGDDYYEGPDDFAGHDQGSADPEGEQPGRPAPLVPFDPRRGPNERDLILAMTDADQEGGMMMDYFDQTFVKNWAGPEHWKLRKVVRRPEATDPTQPKPRREKKEAFKIDFLTPSEKTPKELATELFVPVTRGAGITLPGPPGKQTARKGGRSKKGKEKEDKRNDQTLPDDMHFSSRQLITLFLKPKFSLKMRGARGRAEERGDGEVDENFWAQAAADQAAAQAQGGDGDETGDAGAVPFNTQFFHDDFDDAPGFDDVYDGDGGPSAIEPGEQDLLAATAGQTRRVRPEYVNYAKRAKRVDVRKLKENIWKGLDIVVPEPKENPDEDVDMDQDDPDATSATDARVFDSVISGLQQSYPKDKMEEISTSFCFICLLHLANEKGLKIEAEDGQDETGEKVVGNIWDLKVYRDPTAVPSA